MSLAIHSAFAAHRWSSSRWGRLHAWPLVRTNRAPRTGQSKRHHAGRNLRASCAMLEVSDLDEAVRFANESAYGLSAYPFTRDLSRVMRFSRESAFGELYINGAPANLSRASIAAGNSPAPAAKTVATASTTTCEKRYSSVSIYAHGSILCQLCNSRMHNLTIQPRFGGSRSHLAAARVRGVAPV